MPRRTKLARGVTARLISRMDWARLLPSRSYMLDCQARSLPHARSGWGQRATLGGPIEGPLVVPLQKFGLLPECAITGPSPKAAWEKRQASSVPLPLLPGTGDARQAGLDPVGEDPHLLSRIPPPSHRLLRTRERSPASMPSVSLIPPSASWQTLRWNQGDDDDHGTDLHSRAKTLPRG